MVNWDRMFHASVGQTDKDIIRKVRKGVVDFDRRTKRGLGRCERLPKEDAYYSR